MTAYDGKSPLETAIDKGRMEIWNIMRGSVELTEKEKLEQLRIMIMAGKTEEDNYCKEFKELLSLLSAECSQVVQAEVRLHQLSKAMYIKDSGEAKKKFGQLLDSLSAEMVSS